MKRLFTLILFSSYYVVTAGNVTIINLTGTNYVGVAFTYPVGNSVLPLDGVGTNTLDSLATDFGVTLDPTANHTVVLSGSACEVSQSVDSGNVWPSTLSGMGAGFLWFGFGWCLRLAKRIGTSSDF